ncbi:MAG: bifunctional histidinol-phosphatase/imidazoleglycerol-phosphate dehydratase, partial [Alistipes sp.]|nr:bifunctional histidinol-phosphatase/imidazoleglycerol-phosphate dehydratase [Alistipes sp.]
MKNRVLFIDRDGTILVEPPEDFQVDSLEKLEFVVGAISGMKSLAELDY